MKFFFGKFVRQAFVLNDVYLIAKVLFLKVDKVRSGLKLFRD